MEERKRNFPDLDDGALWLELRQIVLDLDKVPVIPEEQWARLISLIEEEFLRARDEARRRLSLPRMFSSGTDARAIPIWCIEGLKAHTNERRKQLIKEWVTYLSQGIHP